MSQHNEASAWLPLKHCIAPLIKLTQKIKAVSTGYTDSDEPSVESSRDDLCKETGNDLTFMAFHVQFCCYSALFNILYINFLNTKEKWARPVDSGVGDVFAVRYNSRWEAKAGNDTPRLGDRKINLQVGCESYLNLNSKI